ncbi:hypothetical protein N8149_00235 [Gammaproteobacteria bacterium]|nr:hypothetical protein [Gammaproteobacteria bacterium]
MAYRIAWTKRKPTKLRLGELIVSRLSFLSASFHEPLALSVAP